jgi:hypothetical protein
MSPRHVHAAAFTVLRIAHLGQAAALQVVATALEMALGRARLRRDRQQHQRCRQRDDKHSHDLAPFSLTSQVQTPSRNRCRKSMRNDAKWCRFPYRRLRRTVRIFSRADVRFGSKADVTP